ncbi:MAG: hemerythrin domain-containing protein [Gammaproteobacteria bacterium]|nr:hemerythrin domain-containing protein [Gammaproteobacteria bacterium]
MANPTLSAFLTAEHRHLDTLLDQAGNTGCGDDGQAFMALHAALTRHLGIEEQILFEPFERRMGEHGPIAVMRAEHEQIRVLLARTAQERSCRSSAAFQAALDALKTAVGRHEAKEENVLYPTLDQLFAAEVDEFLEALEAMAGVQY